MDDQSDAPASPTLPAISLSQQSSTGSESFFLSCFDAADAVQADFDASNRRDATTSRPDGAGPAVEQSTASSATRPASYGPPSAMDMRDARDLMDLGIDMDMDDATVMPHASTSKRSNVFKATAQSLDHVGHRLMDRSDNAIASRTSQLPSSRDYKRCRVTAIRERSYRSEQTTRFASASTRTSIETVLELEELLKDPGRGGDDDEMAHPSKERRQKGGSLRALLRADWRRTMAEVGDIVHLIGNLQDLPVADEIVVPASSEVGAARIEVKIEAATPVLARAQTSHAELQADEDAMWAGMDIDEDDFPMSTPPVAQPSTVPTLTLSSSPIFAANLLVQHPDILLTATKVADAATCIRRPLVQDRLRGVDSGGISRALVMGNMLHEILQICLQAETPDDVDSDAAAAVPIEIAPATGPEPPEMYEDDDQRPKRPLPKSWTRLGNFSAAFVEQVISAELEANFENLLAAGVDDMIGASEELQAGVLAYVDFGIKYLGQRGQEVPFDLEIDEDGAVQDSRAIKPARLRVTRILDVEEDLWCPMYGLRGKVDVSVEAELVEYDSPVASLTAVAPPSGVMKRANTIAAPPGREQNDNRRTASASTGGRSFFERRGQPPAPPRRSIVVLPLELKTGRAMAAVQHRAQTMLYTLMMSDRYGTDVNSGLLFYSKTGELHRVRRAVNDVRGLIMGRNELATWITKSVASKAAKSEPFLEPKTPAPSDLADIEDVPPAMPPTIDDERACARCYAVDGCMLYRRAVDKVVEDQTDPTAIADLYEEKTAAVTDEHAAFFAKWDHLLSLEEGDITTHRRELWTMTAETRQREGRCFADMILDTTFEVLQGRNPGGRSINAQTYRFVRTPASADQTHMSLLAGSLSRNDPVTISIEPALISVAQGFIIDLTHDTVTVSIDHALDAALSRAVEQLPDRDAGEALRSVVFRIDKDQFSSGMGRIRANVARLFFNGSEVDAKLRQLIVDSSPPRFQQSEQSIELPAHLNEDQRVAMHKVLAAQDHALILGMPGTGKTTTIAELIKLLAREGKSVLLASYTHSAVDTIVRKLVGAPGLRIARLGNVDRVHEDIKGVVWGADGAATSIEQLDEMIMAPNVVATTCLSIQHLVFLRRTFDYCIVDEASQITLPTCLGPLRFAERFVLVGDHHQLPPLVRNPLAREGGLDVSLFKILAESHPEALVQLASQYRMNEDIMTISNELIYDGQLRCGNDDVAARELLVPDKARALGQLHADCPASPTKPVLTGFTPCLGASAGCWVAPLLESSIKAVLLDTAGLPATESKVNNGGHQNEVEALLIQQFAQVLIAGGVPAEDIAVITPYRKQISLLTRLLHRKEGAAGGAALPPLLTAHRHLPVDTSGVEILTADQSQGRDKAVILVSLVRSSAQGGVGDLLQDWRRLNVAFTRAQRKLVVVGDASTLRRSELLGKFVDLMEQRGWVARLGAKVKMEESGKSEAVVEVEEDKASAADARVRPISSSARQPRRDRTPSPSKAPPSSQNTLRKRVRTPMSPWHKTVDGLQAAIAPPPSSSPCRSPRKKKVRGEAEEEEDEEEALLPPSSSLLSDRSNQGVAR